MLFFSFEDILHFVDGIFGRLMELACNSETSNAGASLAAGRSTHVGRVLSEVPDQEIAWPSRVGDLVWD